MRSVPAFLAQAAPRYFARFCLIFRYSRHQSWFSFSRVSALAGTRLHPLGVLSKVCSGLSRFKQPRGFSRGSVLPLSILEVSCLVQPRLCFCLLPGLAPLGVMSEVCSGSSRLRQPRGTLVGSYRTSSLESFLRCFFPGLRLDWSWLRTRLS